MELVEDRKISSPKLSFLTHFENIDFSFDTDLAQSIRERAKEQLSKLELPTTKSEYWKYTRVAPLFKKQYNIGPATNDLNLDQWRFPNTIELVFVNGFYREDLSNISSAPGLKVSSLSEAKSSSAELLEGKLSKLTKQREEVFATMNTAYHNDGVFVHVESNQKVEEPIHVIHLMDGEATFSQPRNIVLLDKGAEASVIESYVASEHTTGGLMNSVTEVFVAPNAKLNHHKVQNLGEGNHQIATEEVFQEGDSHYELLTCTLSGKLVRNNLNTALNNSNSECHYHGLYLTAGKEHVDNHTFIDHIAPHCESHELYKGILNDRSNAVFNGRVLVNQAAQKTNAFQSNANLLLTDDAKINSKPELEIYADDVKCSHGSTTGQLDEDALFYLKARGIEEEKARNLLLYAFAGEVLDAISYEPLRERLDQFIAKRYHNDF